MCSVLEAPASVTLKRLQHFAGRPCLAALDRNRPAPFMSSDDRTNFAQLRRRTSVSDAHMSRLPRHVTFGLRKGNGPSTILPSPTGQRRYSSASDSLIGID
jgi:hypothetical protein